MRRTSRIAVAFSAGLMLALFGLPSLAHAAPSVISSDPEDGETIHGPAPDEVTITFDLPLDPNTSGLIVVDECGRRVDGDDASIIGNQMTVSIVKKPAGEYEAQYKATPPAGATGSASGSINFTVHSGKSCGPGANHQGHGNHEGGGGGHEGGGHEGGSHEGGSHEGGHEGGSHGTGSSGSHTEHSSGTHGSGTHTMSSGHGSGHSDKHSGGSHGGDKKTEHSGHGSGGGVSAAPPIAAPTLPDLTGATVPASTIATSLGLCLLMGLLGGWFVRNSGTR